MAYRDSGSAGFLSFLYESVQELSYSCKRKVIGGYGDSNCQGSLGYME